MTHLGLDMNASRLRAVQGPVGDYALTATLDPPAAELPLAISLEKSTPQVGSAGLRISRHAPHLFVNGFLPSIGHPHVQSPHWQGPRWRAGRYSLDANGAMDLVWQRLTPMARKAAGVVLTVPAYLQAPQLDWLYAMAERSRTTVLGTIPTPLAAAMTAHAEQTWLTSILVLDIDDHALTLAHVRATEGELQVLQTRSFTHLSLRIWQNRLINALADCCVLQSRRDPRDAPHAEQGLFEQLDSLMGAVQQGRSAQVAIQGGQWYQNLLVTPEQAHGFCHCLISRTLQEIDAVCAGLTAEELPGSILVTYEAGRLPGLAASLRMFMEERVRTPAFEGPVRVQEVDEDFGAGLLEGVPGEMSSVVLLAADGPARAAHVLAAAFQRGDLPTGHLELSAPLPLPLPVDAGPPRLHCLGQDFFLDDTTFAVGSQAGSHMYLDPRRHPGVAPRHCDILFDHRTYLIFNRCREGTLLNDAPVAGSAVLHAGDWIRLGLSGPLVRFLGQAGRLLRSTTA